MKKKLLIFHRNIAPYRIDFFNALNEAFDTRVCLFFENLTSQKFDQERIKAQLNFTPTYLLERHVGGFKKGVIRNIKEFQPDIVLVAETSDFSIISALYKPFAKKKYDIVSMIDDSYDQAVMGHHFSMKHKWLEKIMIPVYNNIICVEPRVADFFKEKYGKGIYFPIIRDDQKRRKKYEELLPLSGQYVQKYGLHDKKVVLFVGRLVEIKNVQSVISIFNKLQKSDVVFVIVGSGNYEKELHRLAEGNPQIIFTGRLEGDILDAWYNVADIFILPSKIEPFGAVTNEALLAGCKTLVSNLAGSRCLVNDSVNGFHIDPYNQEDIERKLNIALSEVVTNTKVPVLLKPNLMESLFRNEFKKIINLFNFLHQ